MLQFNLNGIEKKNLICSYHLCVLLSLKFSYQKRSLFTQLPSSLSRISVHLSDAKIIRDNVG